jgi:ABC-2 type transport system permease protein
MNRFLWLIRREIWEHKAIWIAPAIVIACILLLVVSGNVHLGPIGELGDSTVFGELSSEVQVKLLVIVYAGLALVIDMVMGIVAFFYAIDSLYADRRDRSVLFWKSLPLSDAETVLSKFAVAAVVIPIVTLAAALVAQLVVASGGSIKLAMSGLSAGMMWQPEALLGGFVVALLWCITAVLWYAPVIAYLMLVSAWAQKAPFLWAVLPPVGIVLLERVALYTSYAGDFIAYRLLGLYKLLGSREGPQVSSHEAAGDEISKVMQLDLVGSIRNFYSSPDLWLGVIAAGLLLAAAMWVRRYRDETS